MKIELNVFCLDDIEVQAKGLLELCDGSFTFNQVREKILKESIGVKE